MKSTFKFALLSGVLGVIAAILCGLSFGIRGLSRRGDLGVFISGLVFAVPVFLGPYLASKREWLSFPVSLGRAVLAALPLPFLPLAFFVGMIGWGDMQEHLIRAVLHAIHREISGAVVGTLIMVGIVVFGAAAMSPLIWISISILTKRWRAQTLLILWTGCVLLSGLFWATLFALRSGGTGVTAIGLILVFSSCFLFAFAVEMNARASRGFLAFRFAAAFLAFALVAGGSLLIAKSVPEKHFPSTGQEPVWTFDLGVTGCRPVWGGPDSSAAANEIAFATSDALGMAFETVANPLANNKWEYKSCVFSVNTKSGKLNAQISIDGGQPTINGTPDGNFKVRAGGHLTTYTSALKELGEPETENEPTEKWTAAKWHNFRSDPDGKLWFEGDGKRKLLAQYPPNGAFIHPLGTERVLVTAGGEFSIYSADGAQVSTEHFTREGVRFAALSADRRRFAVSVYLWGVGDPSYLEEEKIIVFDAETGKVIAAVPSVPLPNTQSWAALSPDGTLLAVGAQATLRLFRLPQEGQR